MTTSSVRRAEVDGVPVFWVDGPAPYTAGLIFGAALWQESAIDRGLSHLVEHLALHGVGKVAYQWNGQVDLVGTSFLVRGEASEAAHFLNRAVRTLDALPLARLEQEARVLAAEAAGRPSSPVGALGHLRWGLQALGLVDEPEYGLLNATPERIEDWRQSRFVRSNAALWCTGPPPDGIDFAALPDKGAVSAGLPRPLRSGACYETWPAPRFSFGTVVAREAIAPVALAMLQSWLMEHVRDVSGAAYGVAADYFPLTADEAFAIWTVDGPPDHLVDTLDAVLAAFDHCRTSGLAVAELDLYRERQRRAEIEAPGMSAASAAAAHVQGRPDPLDDSWRIELAQMEVESVSAKVCEWLGELQWIVPTAAQPPVGSAIPPNDLMWKSLGPSAALRSIAPHPLDPEPYELLVSPEGVGLRYTGGTDLTVRFASLAVARRYDSGLRVLYDRDGTSMVYDPSRWGEPPHLGEWIDASCGGLLVDMGPVPLR